MENLKLYKFNYSGFNVNVCKTKKFKTINIVSLIKFRYEDDLVTERSLLSYIFEQGSTQYPLRQMLENVLGELFGTKIVLNITRKMSQHIIMLNMEVPNEKYIQNNHILKNAIQLIYDLIFHPGIYSNEYGEQALENAKRNLRDKIKEIDSNAFLKANNKALEQVYENKKLMSPYGLEEEIPDISIKDMKSLHKKLLSTAAIDFYFIGDIHENKIANYIKEIFKVHNNYKIFDKSMVNENYCFKNKNKIIKEGDGTNGLLVLIYKINDEKKINNKVANGVFGRFPTSLLFKSVREEKNIAYFTISHIDQNNGFIVVNIGVKEEDLPIALDDVETQLQKIKKG